LLEGTTWRAEAGDFPVVRQEAVRIAEALRPMGPSNIQMRLDRGRAVCFEINVRFSGTTPIRARFGFNDVEAALRHYVLGEPAADLPLVTQGIALRYWNEAYPDPEAVAELDRSSSLDHSAGFHTAIEDYGVKP
jgi:carbamoyl-phosphate synthase large subunit